ncbi:MAG: DUF11 domain-containing protein, partial [Actinomycetia bacterium]|nr:DUF11 domain-containing protein [Actinomycetes bacterium]
MVIGTLEKDAEFTAPLCVGGNIRYRVTLTNLSPDVLDAAICDPIPEGTTYVDGSAVGGEPTVRAVGLCIYWEGPLAPGESHILSFSVTVDDPGASTIVNRASGRLGEGVGVVEYPLEIECPPTITASYAKDHDSEERLCHGSRIDYTLTLTNTSEADSLVAEIEDLIPAGTTYVAGSAAASSGDVEYLAADEEIRWDGVLDSGKTATVTFAVTVDNDAKIGDEISSTFSGGSIWHSLFPEDAVDFSDYTDTDLVRCSSLDLDLDFRKESVPDQPLCPGSTIDYTLTLRNNTDEADVLEGFINDAIPEGTTFVEGTEDTYNPNDNRVEWSGALRPGDSQVIRFTVRVGSSVEPGTEIVNQAGGWMRHRLYGSNGESFEDETRDRVANCDHGEEVRRPLIVIPGSMGTLIEATDNLTLQETGEDPLEVPTGTNLWPGELADTGVPTFDQSQYYFLEFTPQGKPRYPTDIPAWAQPGHASFDPTRSPMVDKAGIKIYEATIDFLQHNGGYALGKTLFAYGWDWRKGAGWKNDERHYQNVIDLDRFIDQALIRYREHTGNETVDEVDILAHSQGGYVAWLFVSQSANASNKVRNLITVGTPYLGSPKATATLLWGVSYQKYFFGPDARTTQRISRYMPGVAELVPPAEFIPYLDDPGNLFNRGRRWFSSADVIGGIIPDQLNNRPIIQRALDLRKDLHQAWGEPPAGIDIFLISGTGKPSWANFIMKKNIRLEFPVFFKGVYQRNFNGDETVPFRSHVAAHVLDGDIRRYLTRNQEHVESFTGGTSMKVALNILRGLDPVSPGPSGFQIPAGDARRFGTPGWSDILTVSPMKDIGLRCPLHIELVDGAGNRTGALPDGGVEEGIPDSSFTQLGLAGSKTISTPSDGSYELRLESYATADDVFDLGIVERDQEGIATELTAYLEVPVTPDTRGRLDLDDGGWILFLDQDGDGSFEEQYHPDLAGGADRDGDGLIDGIEVFDYETDPDIADTDGDGINDGDEVHVHFSDPLNPDPPAATSLLLSGGRFLVEVEWRDFQGSSGEGRAVTMRSSDSGLFYFFDADNWEVLVKVLDGCGFNDHFWVFSAATTNVEYTLRVTDTETGATSEYFNALGQAAPAVTDTAAFATCADGAAANARWVNLAAAVGDGALVTSSAASEGAGHEASDKQACLDSPAHLCLDGRFQVEADWRDFQGNTGAARLVPFRAEDSG